MSNKHGTDQPFMLYANEIAFVPTLKPHTVFPSQSIRNRTRRIEFYFKYKISQNTKYYANFGAFFTNSTIRGIEANFTIISETVSATEFNINTIDLTITSSIPPTFQCVPRIDVQGAFRRLIQARF